MTITQLIEKLQELQTDNPDMEVRYHLRDLEPETKGYTLVFETVHASRDAFGSGCIFRLISDRELPPK